MAEQEFGASQLFKGTEDHDLSHFKCRNDSFVLSLIHASLILITLCVCKVENLRTAFLQFLKGMLLKQIAECLLDDLKSKGGVESSLDRNVFVNENSQ